MLGTIDYSHQISKRTLRVKIPKCGVRGDKARGKLTIHHRSHNQHMQAQMFSRCQRNKGDK